jgi:hypothetical protein
MPEYAVGRDDVLSALRGALGPLDHVQALRILHDPTRHNFQTRYVHYDLPEEDVRRLAELFFVADADELSAKRERAEPWFHEVLLAIHDGPLTDDIERAARRAQGGGDDG